MFKVPSEKDLPDAKLSTTQRVKVLYSLQWHFYRNSYYQLLKIAGIQLAIIGLLSMALYSLELLELPNPSSLRAMLRTKLWNYCP